MSNNLFAVDGESPAGWKVTGMNGDYIIIVQGDREKADEVSYALNRHFFAAEHAQLLSEEEAFERGG